MAGFSAGAEFKYYFFNTALKGFYAGGFAEYRTFNLAFSFPDFSNSDVKLSANLYGGGLVAGYQFILFGGLAIDIFGGAGFYAGGVNEDVKSGNGTITPIPTMALAGLIPKYGLSLGWAF